MAKSILMATVLTMILVSCKDPKVVEERPFGSVEERDTTGMITFEAFYLESSSDSCPMETLSIYPMDSTFSIIWRSGSGATATGHIIQENAKAASVWKLVCDSDNNIYLLSRESRSSGEWIFTGFNDSTYIKSPIVLRQKELL